MDRIEQLTGWDPDFGSGLLELGLFGLAVAVTVAARSATARSLLERRSRRRAADGRG